MLANETKLWGPRMSDWMIKPMQNKEVTVPKVQTVVMSRAGEDVIGITMRRP